MAEETGERAAFEAWAVKYHGRHTLTDPDAGSMWSAWQARAAPVALQQPERPADFWQRCIRLGVVVVPFRAYLGYDEEGNYDETKYAGIRYVCVPHTDAAVLTPRYFRVHVAGTNDLNWVADTPDGALDAYERRMAESRGNS